MMCHTTYRSSFFIENFNEKNSIQFIKYNMQGSGLEVRWFQIKQPGFKPRGGGDTSYKWANGDVPLDGVAFSQQD